MKIVFSIALGGALGALCRYGCSTSIYHFLGRNFPYGTLAVNVIGSFIIGLLSVLFIDKVMINQEIKIGILTGFLGAFTTFSTFSLEAVILINTGQALKSLLYMVSSVGTCLIAVYLGMLCADKIGIH